MLDRFRNWLRALPEWGRWLYYAIAFGIPMGLLNRSVIGGILAGVLFASLMMLVNVIRRGRQSGSDPT